tara:strand:+ start:1475 stop:2188 length:714 start_codon:yes stop_codon:yes gene_type:complete
MVEQQPAKKGPVVIFDAETDSGFERLCGYSRDAYLRTVMQFTCLCALEVPTDAVEACKHLPDDVDTLLEAGTKHTFWRDLAEDDKTPVHDLLALFDRATLIVGYNVLAFDFPLLWRFYKPVDGLTALQRYHNHRAKTHDVMTRVRDVTEQYVKLDLLLQANKLPLKLGRGENAPKLWESNRREELEQYCAFDVEVTARLALLPTIQTADGVWLPNQVHGMRSALAAQLAQSESHVTS